MTGIVRRAGIIAKVCLLPTRHSRRRCPRRPRKATKKSSEYNIAYLELHACSFDIIKRNVVKSHSYSTLLLLAAAAHVHRAPLPCSALPKNEGRIENPHLEKFDDYLYECHC